VIASAIGVRPELMGLCQKSLAVYWWTLWRTDFSLLGSTTAIRSQRRILLLRTHSTELKSSFKSMAKMSRSKFI
jgi:hypothetical protein